MIALVARKPPDVTCLPNLGEPFVEVVEVRIDVVHLIDLEALAEDAGSGSTTPIRDRHDGLM